MICLLLIYVDDIIITLKSLEIIEEIKNKIQKIFEIRDLGEVTHCLGMEIIKNEEGIFSINQEKYIKQLLKDFNLEDTKGSVVW